MPQPQNPGEDKLPLKSDSSHPAPDTTQASSDAPSPSTPADASIDVLSMLRSTSLPERESGWAILDQLSREKELFPLALHILDGNRQLAQDVVQITYLQGWRALAQFRGETVNDLIDWLRSICRHCAFTFGNRLTRERRHLSADEFEVRLKKLQNLPEPDPTLKVVDTMFKPTLISKLNVLSLTERTCVLLRAQGYEISEIANRLGLSSNGVSCNISHARQKLRAAYPKWNPTRGFADDPDLT